MKTTTKRMAALLACIMLVTLLAACAGNNNAPESGNAGNTDGAAGQTNNGDNAAVEEPEEPVVLEWLGYDSYAEPDADSAVVQMVEEKFNAEFDFWYVDAQKWDDNLNVKLAAGEMPDVLKIPNRQNIAKYVDQGILAPIPKEKFEELAPTYTAFIDENYPEAWDGVMFNGEIYAIPTTNLNGSYPTVVIWRQDWLDNVGIAKVPETLEEYEEALYKFRNDDPDGNGQKDTYGLSDFALPNILGAFGYPGISDFKQAAKGDPSKSLQFTEKDGQLVFAAVQPEMKEALAVLQQWYADGIIDPEFLTSENTTGYWADSQAFYNGKIGLTGMGMFYHWRHELDPSLPDDVGGGQYKAFMDAQPDGELAFGVPAVGPEGKSGTPQWDTTSHPVAITTKAAEDPRKLDTVLQMVEAAVTDYEYYLSVTSGEEGVDWKLDGDTFVNLSAADSVADQNKKGKNVLSVKVSYDEYLKKKDPFIYAFGDKYANINGYTSMFVPTVEVFEKNSSALNKLTIETYLKIITGESPVDAFDAYTEQFMRIGGTEVEEAVNAAYDELMGR
ncbi:ABC transporter substrate-binding protein [Paenibacillus sp. IB182496]|uniref:ABC transporter substrate-binding protein n=1 Tax=Paenibacillus sabuli TaxID=2772509 RepID=A0A927BV67_9BACL|nr:extracellular solute-binding protein [Paenibacillus sabuli]MBD2847438.1 ABC transporter substrate-binding protein [Paenibacillus sabuli]